MKPPVISFVPLIFKDLTFLHEENKTLVDGLVNIEKLHSVAPLPGHGGIPPITCRPWSMCASSRSSTTRTSSLSSPTSWRRIVSESGGSSQTCHILGRLALKHIAE
ncbi:hypothetical protein P7K49_039623, partial [Saguinus oedipus]